VCQHGVSRSGMSRVSTHATNATDAAQASVPLLFRCLGRLDLAEIHWQQLCVVFIIICAYVSGTEFLVSIKCKVTCELLKLLFTTPQLTTLLIPHFTERRRLSLGICRQKVSNLFNVARK